MHRQNCSPPWEPGVLTTCAIPHAFLRRRRGRSEKITNSEISLAMESLEECEGDWKLPSCYCLEHISGSRLTKHISFFLLQFSVHSEQRMILDVVVGLLEWLGVERVHSGDRHHRPSSAAVQIPVQSKSKTRDNGMQCIHDCCMLTVTTRELSERE